MDAKTIFTRYELFGVVIPGASLLLGLWVLYPQSITGLKLSISDFSLGGLGIFAIAALCVGHILQAPANLLVDFWWRYRGRPTEKMVAKGGGLADPQVDLIPVTMQKLLGYRLDRVATGSEWRAATAAIASFLTTQGRAGRLEEFNGIYGLHRGLTVALCFLTIVAIINHDWPFAVISALAMLATGYRMHRFSRYYAREL